MEKYVSIKEILDEEIKSGYPGLRHIYKLKESNNKDDDNDRPSFNIYNHA